MTQTRNYAAASRALLAQTQEELDKDDLRQASEKGWGAAAQMVKAVGESRGWRHDGHAVLFEMINQPVSETGYSQLGMDFHTANNLHINFYENTMGRELVDLEIESIHRLVEGLEQLIP
jgi:hypothetical protein